MGPLISKRLVQCSRILVGNFQCHACRMHSLRHALGILESICCLRMKTSIELSQIPTWKFLLSSYENFHRTFSNTYLEISNGIKGKPCFCTCQKQSWIVKQNHGVKKTNFSPFQKKCKWEWNVLSLWKCKGKNQLVKIKVIQKLPMSLKEGWRGLICTYGGTLAFSNEVS